MQKRKGIILNPISFVLHHTTLIVIAIAVTLVMVLGGKFELASAAQPNNELEIQKLTVCYALGLDAIGGGNLQEGKNIFRDCFTPNAEVTMNSATGVLAQRTGSDAWADYAYSFYRERGYQATQHLIGTINVSISNANQATMSSYFLATAKSETNVNVSNGTYYHEVVKEHGRWKIRRLTLNALQAPILYTVNPQST